MSNRRGGSIRNNVIINSSDVGDRLSFSVDLRKGERTRGDERMTMRKDWYQSINFNVGRSNQCVFDKWLLRIDERNIKSRSLPERIEQVLGQCRQI
jgi:hypothetical protein